MVQGHHSIHKPFPLFNWGLAAGKVIKAGDFVCEYKYSSCYPTKEMKDMETLSVNKYSTCYPRKVTKYMEEAYTINGEGSYTLEVQVA